MFEKLTEIKLNRDDSFPKNICLRFKVKLDSALGFREMCLLSRNNQGGGGGGAGGGGMVMAFGGL